MINQMTKRTLLALSLAASAAIISGCSVYPNNYNQQSYGYPQQSYTQYQTQNVAYPVNRQNVSARVNNGQVTYYDSQGNTLIREGDSFYRIEQQAVAAPQYTQSPQYIQQPQTQYYQQQPRQSVGPNILGATVGLAAGGLAGSQIGKGNGNLAAIGATSATGALVGSGCRTVNGGQVLGAVFGGLLGSRIGKGSGRQISTSIGSGIGALVGNDMAGGCLTN